MLGAMPHHPFLLRLATRPTLGEDHLRGGVTATRWPHQPEIQVQLLAAPSNGSSKQDLRKGWMPKPPALC